MLSLKCIARKLEICTPSLLMQKSHQYTSKLDEERKFETVFTFPFVKYVALFNRLKVYHIIGSSIAVPSCGLLEMFNVLAEESFFTAASIGVTGAAVLSIASIPFINVIGYLYISEDNQHIKISSIDFWGKRKNKIISADDWIPLYDMGSKKTDSIYLSPQLSDNTKYKLFLKFGNVLNSKKMGQVLE